MREGLRMARGGVACGLSTVVHCECKGASSYAVVALSTVPVQDCTVVSTVR